MTARLLAVSDLEWQRRGTAPPPPRTVLHGALAGAAERGYQEPGTGVAVIVSSGGRASVW